MRCREYPLKFCVYDMTSLYRDLNLSVITFFY